MKDYQIAPEDLRGIDNVQEIIKTEAADDIESKLDVDHISAVGVLPSGTGRQDHVG